MQTPEIPRVIEESEIRIVCFLNRKILASKSMIQTVVANQLTAENLELHFCRRQKPKTVTPANQSVCWTDTPFAPSIRVMRGLHSDNNDYFYYSVSND